MWQYAVRGRNSNGKGIQMSYEQWKIALNRIPFFSRSAELKELSTAYSVFAQRASTSHVERLAEAYEAWKNCGRYNTEVNALGRGLEQSLKTDAGIVSQPTIQPTIQATCQSAYDRQVTIDEDHGAVTMLAYTAFIGGHTHLAFEYMRGDDYWHVVFHLCACGGGFCGQSCTGTTACILKNVPIGKTENDVIKYGYVGGEGAYNYALRKHKGPNTLDSDDYELKDLGAHERNLPNDDGWTNGKGYESKTISVMTDTAKKGHRLCRHLIDGSGTDKYPDLHILAQGIETERFHKTNRRKGTNCVQFAMQVLEALHIYPNKTMKFHAWSSPPRAIKYGKLANLNNVPLIGI